MGCTGSSQAQANTTQKNGGGAKGGRMALKTLNTINLEGHSDLGGAIHDVFRGYDKNGNGNIDTKELKLMVTELSGIIPTVNLDAKEAQQIASAVMKALDNDRSGVVDEKEFSDWLQDQIHNAEARKSQLIAGGPQGKALFKFLMAVEACLKMQIAGVGIFDHDKNFEPGSPPRKVKASAKTRPAGETERRYDGDHGPFPKSEFIEHYGPDEGEAVWQHSELETREADDGHHYTLEEFIEHYGGTEEWKTAHPDYR
eukprot:g1107.t1